MGCGNELPSVERDISDFVPRDKKLSEVVEVNFGESNFPENCEWFEIDSVSDGDTIVLGDGSRVRFIGVDTPETVHPSKPVQYCGVEASDWIKKVFKDEEKVCLIYDELSDDLDKYGRRLAYPFTEEGMDVSVELLRLGLARGYLGFPFSRKEEFRWYHDEAKRAKVGLWGKGNCEEVN